MNIAFGKRILLRRSLIYVLCQNLL